MHKINFIVNHSDITTTDAIQCDLKTDRQRGRGREREREREKEREENKREKRY